MKLPHAVLAGALLLAGCSAEPFPGPLTGSWGGAFMLVSATRSAVVMSVGCFAEVTINHPLILDGSGNFATVDSMRGSFDGGARDTLPSQPVQVLIKGTLKGDVLTLKLEPTDPARKIFDGDAVYLSGQRDQPEPMQVCRT